MCYRMYKAHGWAAALLLTLHLNRLSLRIPEVDVKYSKPTQRRIRKIRLHDERPLTN